MRRKQWEIHAAYGGLSASDLGRIMSDRKLNPFTQSKLLAAALAMPFKEIGRDHYRSLIQDERGHQPYESVQIADGLVWLERLGLERSPFDGFDVLPCYSFALELRFELARPYLSRDDDAFYIIDNPVRKDKVFKVPLVAPTSWKGGLRATATQDLLAVFSELLPKAPPAHEAEREALLPQLWEERARRVRIFGNEKGRAFDSRDPDVEPATAERPQGDEKGKEAGFLDRWLAPRLFRAPPGEGEQDRRARLKKQARQLGKDFQKHLITYGYRTEKVQGRQGRLFCFPTFFDQIWLEIINPHDRERRVGKNPILFESVPAGATGTLRLLYVPYDWPGEVTPDEAALRQQVGADLPLVAEAVRDLLAVYGFGAKTSSGFGTADPRRVAGELRVNRLDEGAKAAEGPTESLVRRLLLGDPLEHQLKDDFFVDGQFVLLPDDEIKQQPWRGKTRANYKKVKPRVLELLDEQPAGPAYLARAVTDLDDLPGLARELAAMVGGGV